MKSSVGLYSAWSASLLFELLQSFCGAVALGSVVMAAFNFLEGETWRWPLTFEHDAAMLQMVSPCAAFHAWFISSSQIHRRSWNDSACSSHYRGASGNTWAELISMPALIPDKVLPEVDWL